MNCQLLALLVILALFSQASGFCGPRTLQTSLTRSAVRAAEWLRNRQDENGTYGDGHVSAFAYHSLRLIGHSVESGSDHLNAEIINADIGSLSGGRVALYILGALATCRDPQNFYDFNLVSSLKNKLSKFPQVGFDHPFQYSLAVLALCSSGKDLGKKKLTYVKDILKSIPNQLEHAYGDTLAMHVLALKCIKKSIKKPGMKKALLKKINTGIDIASKELLNRQLNDTTFGQNEVTAALASQALLAAGVKKTKCSKTLRWLKSRQNPDGSFINLLSTIYVIPALIGALPYDLKDMRCPKNTTGGGGENAMINVCVELQFNVSKYSDGKTPPPPVCVTVFNGTNAHDILKEAAKNHSCYNFTTLDTPYGRSIESICGIYRRPADKFYWMIYIDGKSAPVGIDDLRPGHGSKLSFQYKKLNWG
ncbi:hypothetical protein ACROYT_G010337 [Oculina patagonica]